MVQGVAVGLLPLLHSEARMHAVSDRSHRSLERLIAGLCVYRTCTVLLVADYRLDEVNNV